MLFTMAKYFHIDKIKNDLAIIHENISDAEEIKTDSSIIFDNFSALRTSFKTESLMLINPSFKNIISYELSIK